MQFIDYKKTMKTITEVGSKHQVGSNYTDPEPAQIEQVEYLF